MSFSIYLMFFMSLSSFLIYCNSFKHILMALLALELSVINVFLVTFFVHMYTNESFISIYFLVISICESILGISLLVMMIRFKGFDLMDCLSIMKW